MKFFLDSAILEEIRYAYANYRIDGVTTNPKHIKSSGKSFLRVIREIADEFEGRAFPISVEVDPHLSETAEMVAAAEELAAMSSNFVIKIPCTEQGLAAAAKLEQQGIRTNVTLVFSPSQALQAGRIGAKYVSPFLGWQEASGSDIEAFCLDVVQIYRNYGFDTEIIMAAIRNGRQIANSAVLGADIVTAGLQVYKDAFDHPFTDRGMKIFQDAWDSTEKE